MTRAEKRLFLTCARSRRRYGGGPLEPRIPSRFLDELPARHAVQLGTGASPHEFDLFAERHEVRRLARKNTYTGKTYNSLENIAQFFEARGLEPPPAEPPVVQRPPAPAAGASPGQPGPRKLRPGLTVEHPRWGRGLVLRREGEGDEAKLTVSFPGHGLKKLIAKYAGLRIAE
jgi:DNA helicase-2/ATP-dependent DNA helicase PcrA